MTYSNIQQAINNGHKWHVISDNEIHSFQTKKEAKDDAKDVPDWNKYLEIISEENAVKKYSF